MKRRWFAVLVLAALAGAACGRDDPVASDATAASEEAPTSAAASSESTAGDGTTASSEAPEMAAAGLADGGFGDLGVVCSPGEAIPVEGVPGIEGTTISVGTMADPGFVARPGLNQEIFDSAEAFVKWCNEHGGVRGYELALSLRDTNFTEHPQRIVEACDEDFFLVGSGVVNDDAGQPDRLECELPEIAGFFQTPTAFDADIALSPGMTSVDEYNVGEVEWLSRAYPELTSKIGFLTGDIPGLQTIRDRYFEHFTQLGWEPVYSGQYNVLGESNWKPFAQAASEAGVEVMFFIGEPGNFAALQQAAQDLDWTPTVWITSVNHYDQLYLDIAGDAIVNTYIRTVFHPFELADENPATADYLEMMETYDPGGKISVLGENGMSAWVLFAKAVGECADSGTLDRDCVYSTAAQEGEWTGGGLHAPIDVTGDALSGCYLMLEASPDGFSVVEDDTTDGVYRCTPDAISKQTGDYGSGERCPSGKVDPLPSECAA